MEEVRKEIVKEFKKVLGRKYIREGSKREELHSAQAGRSGLHCEGVGPLVVEKPPGNIDADLSVPCFDFAKQMKKPPQQIAEDLSKKISPKYVKEVKALGPYLNFYIDWKSYGQKVLQDSLKKNYGMGKRKGKYMVEFAQPNTHKAFHIGHTRNIALGEALNRILEFSGLKVIRVNYQGDIGPHVAKCLWGLKNLKLKGSGGKFLGKVYAKASQKIKGNKKLEEEVRQINKDLYAGKKDLIDLWRKTRKWSLDYFNDIYKDFGVEFDRFYFESEVEGLGVKLSKKLLKQGIAKKSEGAIIMDLKKYNLGVFVLLTRDETPLYSIKDLVLADLQDKEYKPDKIIHVVGYEQNFYFQQLFKSLEKINPKIAKKEYHLSYNLVNLPTGKMASREGKVILYDDLKDKLYKLALNETKKRSNLKGKDLEKVSKIISLGALKYTMISQSPDKPIIFDWERVLDFQDNTAPYIQYTYARARSILRKSLIKGKVIASDLKERKEILLMKKLSEFPEIVLKASEDLRPHYIANYVFELATLFNEFYHEFPVIGSDKEKARIKLVEAVSYVLARGLYLLGIEAPERM